MSPADLDLARELVTHPRSPWPEVSGGAFELADGVRWRRHGERFVPDLDDPATAGVLDTPGHGDGTQRVHEGPTLAVAAARALLAAWGPA